MKYFALEFSNFNSTFYNWIQTGLISFNRNCQTINMFFILYCHWNRLDMAWPGLTWLCLAHNTNVFDQCWRMLDTTYATYAKHFMEYLSFGVNWQLYLSVVPIANLCFSSESNFMWIFLWCLNIIRCITSSFYADWLDKSFDGTKLFMCGSVRFSLVQFYRNCDYKVQNDWDMSIIFPFGWPDLSVEELFFRVKISFAENKSDWTNRNVKKM